jgi:DNA-binding transcriptional LysR family regulator
LAKNARIDGISLSLELKPSGVPSVALLRDGRCDLIVTPLPPDAGDLFQQRLFSGEMKCFYDPAITTAPSTIAEYLAAEHISVRFALGGTAHDLLKSPDLTEFPKAKITVSNFSGIAPFVKGTSLLATEMEFKRFTSLRELAMAPLPFVTEPATIFMVWHQRSNNDPAHKWLRQKVKEIGIGLTSMN